MLNPLFQKIVRKRSTIVVDRISSYIINSKKIIDIGSGTGDVAYLLKQRGKYVTPVDVGDFHGPRLVKTTIYDGKTLPFPNKSFDTALLLMVMHHTPNPEIVFSEATRVAKEVVVIETSYTNPINRFFTIVLYAIGNLRFEVFWNSYKTDDEWRKFFENHGFKISNSQKFHDTNLGFIPFLHILYCLKKK
ncbi:MAG: class I SAM-dependent methyltransferase [Patescibacteria group bacterium]